MEFRSTTQRQHAQSNGSRKASKNTVTGNLIAAVIDVVINLPVMHSVWLERRALSKLSDEQLNDIGIHPNHARTESRRRFFDIPFARRKRARDFRMFGKLEAQFVKPFDKKRF